MAGYRGSRYHGPRCRSSRITNSLNRPDSTPPTTPRTISTVTVATNTAPPAEVQKFEPKKANTNFRFLDLPAEIRNRIYSQTFTSRTERDLTFFRIPPITLVSKQVRKESLPVLFANHHFRIVIGCGFSTPHYNRYGGRPQWTLEKPTVGTAGLLYFNDFVNDFLIDADEAARFLDVTVEVHTEWMMDLVEEWQWQDQEEDKGPRKLPAIVYLHLRVVEGKLEVSVEEGSHHPKERPDGYTPPVHVEDVEAVVDKAIEVARGVASQDGFKGFKLDDLKAVAAAFRFESY